MSMKISIFLLTLMVLCNISLTAGRNRKIEQGLTTITPITTITPNDGRDPYDASNEKSSEESRTDISQLERDNHIQRPRIHEKQRTSHKHKNPRHNNRRRWHFHYTSHACGFGHRSNHRRTYHTRRTHRRPQNVTTESPVHHITPEPSNTIVSTVYSEYNKSNSTTPILAVQLLIPEESHHGELGPKNTSMEVRLNEKANKFLNSKEYSEEDEEENKPNDLDAGIDFGMDVRFGMEMNTSPRPVAV